MNIPKNQHSSNNEQTTENDAHFSEKFESIPQLPSSEQQLEFTNRSNMLRRTTTYFEQQKSIQINPIYSLYLTTIQKSQLLYRFLSKQETLETLASLFSNLIASSLFIMESTPSMNHRTQIISDGILFGILCVVFAIEYADQITHTNYRWDEIKRPSNILDLSIVILLFYESIALLIPTWSLPTIHQYAIYFVLALKLIKVKSAIQSLIILTNNDSNPNDAVALASHADFLQFKIYSSIMNILMLCLFTTAGILLVNELSGGEAKHPYSKNELTFTNALYFQVVSMTTIGYGDIVPVISESRVMTTVVIIISAILFANWLGEILNLVSKKQEYISNKIIAEDSQGSFVIIGNLFNNTNQIQQFLDNHFANSEQVKSSQQRFIYTSIIYYKLLLNHICSFLLPFFIDKILRKLVFVQTTPPRHDPNAYIQRESLRINYGIKKIKFIVNQQLDKDLTWIHEAHLEEAKYLLCYFYEDNDDCESRMKSELNYSQQLTIIHNKFPKLKIMVAFTTSQFIDSYYLKTPQIFKGVNAKLAFSNAILAHASENRGIGAFIQLIIHNKQMVSYTIKNYSQHIKSLPKTQSEYLLQYYIGTRNTLSSIRFPSSLFGYKFNFAQQIFSAIDWQQNKHIKNEGIESASIILLAIKSHKKKRLIINPQNYVISKRDKGIFIAQNKSSIEFLKNLTVNQIEELQRVIENHRMAAPWKQSPRNLKNLNFNQLSQNAVTELRQMETISHHLNLLKYSHTLPFMNHFVFVGFKEEDIECISDQILYLNPNRSLVFIQPDSFSERMIKLKKRNVFLIECSLTDPKNLEIINLKECTSAIFRFSYELQSLPSLELFRLYRTMQEFYPRIHFEIALYDQNYLRFLDRRPFSTTLPWMFWPKIMGGSTLLEMNQFHSMNSLLYSKKSIAQFIQMIIPNSVHSLKQQQQQLQQIEQQQEYDIHPQHSIFSFEISKKCSEEINTYGELKWYLLNEDSPILAVALLKKHKQLERGFSEQNSRHSFTSSNELAIINNSNIHEEQIQNQKRIPLKEKVNIVEEISDMLLINPLPTVQIKEGDFLIVIGSNDIHNHIPSDYLLSSQSTLLKKMENVDRNKRSSSNLQDSQQSRMQITPEIIQKQLELTQRILEMYQAKANLIASIR